MPRRWRLVRWLAGLGLLLFLSGLGWDTIFAGIPYQDETPEQAARYRFHAQVSATAMIAGTLMLIAAPAIAFTRILRRRLGKRTGNST